MTALIGIVGREITATGVEWDAFAVVAWFDPPPRTARLATWWYSEHDVLPRLVGSTVAAGRAFEELRDAVEVPEHPVRVAVVTHVRASGATDLRLHTAAENLDYYLGVGATAESIGGGLRPLAPAQAAAPSAPKLVPSPSGPDMSRVGVPDHVRRAAEQEALSGPTIPLTVWRPDRRDPTGGVPDDLCARLSAEDARQLADYLDGGALVAAARGFLPDPWSGSDRGVVPINKRTDGQFTWDDAITYYVRRYRLNPGSAILAQARARGFVTPDVPKERVSHIIDQLFSGAPGGGSVREWGVRLDGSQVLPGDVYCVYRGRVYRFGPDASAAGDYSSVRITALPGSVIPDGFVEVDEYDAAKQTSAYGIVPMAEITGIHLVATACRYKGAKATVSRIDGNRWELQLDGPDGDGPAPSDADWKIFPRVDASRAPRYFARVDPDEVARVTVVVLACRLVYGRLVTEREALGSSAGDRAYGIPSPSDSPFLPPRVAVKAFSRRIAAIDPNFPKFEINLHRLKHAWRIAVSDPTFAGYYVDDDGEVYQMDPGVPPEQVDVPLTAEYLGRHPAIDPPGGYWPV
ncbi:hypothetical protein [Tsukamurella sp. NPDC003166]|uniref:hypothetical protein n=1 Tax=Tsukamurella sp. NPDC003166 TaxID=3154444 RepID=UPI0033A79372